jgi:hypothetical protein
MGVVCGNGGWRQEGAIPDASQTHTHLVLINPSLALAPLSLSLALALALTLPLAEAGGGGGDGRRRGVSFLPRYTVEWMMPPCTTRLLKPLPSSPTRPELGSSSTSDGEQD